MSRVIQEHIKKPLADEVLFGKLTKGGTVKVSLAKDEDGKEKIVLEAIEDVAVKPKKLPAPKKTARKPAGEVCNEKASNLGKAGG